MSSVTAISGSKSFRFGLFPNSRSFFRSPAYWFVLVSIGFLFFSSQLAAQGSGGVPLTIATVNGEKVTEENLRLLERSIGAHLPEVGASQEMLIDELINQALISQVIEKEKFHLRDDVSEVLELQRKRTLVAMYLQELAREFMPSEDELRAEYARRARLLPTTEYKVGFLLVSEKSLANNLIASLDAGANFSQLAREHSIDPTKSSGGSLGWVTALQLESSLADEIARLEVGEHSELPIASDQGWQILKVSDKRKTILPTYYEQKDMIAQQLILKRVQRFISELREDADVKVIK